MSWAEVKKINSDMTTPLDATLGKRGDAAGTAPGNSMFSWVKAIAFHLAEAVSHARMAQIDTIAHRADAIAASNVVAHGAVKSVQRGTSSGMPGFNFNQAIRHITISAVNPQKCAVSLNGYWSRDDDQSGQHRLPLVAGLTATTLSVRGTVWNQEQHRVTYFEFSWEVIEYF